MNLRSLLYNDFPSSFDLCSAITREIMCVQYRKWLYMNDFSDNGWTQTENFRK